MSHFAGLQVGIVELVGHQSDNVLASDGLLIVFGLFELCVQYCRPDDCHGIVVVSTGGISDRNQNEIPSWVSADFLRKNVVVRLEIIQDCPPSQTTQ